MIAAHRLISFALNWLLLASFGIGAQAQSLVSLEEAQAWVLSAHPLALAAQAVEQRGPAVLLAARGAYDPQIQGGYERKEYVGQEYFEYAEAAAVWQSPYAVKIEAGRQWAEGIYINPELTVPAAGQSYLSVKLPVLQGLLTDKYRIGVEQGRVALDLNRAAANVIRNELRYDLAVRFAEWAYAQRVLEISIQTELLIQVRLQATRGLYEQGDKPAVDTLEAAIAQLNQALLTQLAMVEAQLAEQELRALYWVLPIGSSPNSTALAPMMPLDSSRVVSNPELTQIRAEFADLELQRRLYREYLKPRLDLSYSLLGNGFDFTPATSADDEAGFLTTAYKVGATFRYPILNRQARGQVQLVDIKRAETGAKLESKRQQLEVKARANAIAAAAFERQLIEVEGLAAKTQALLQAERELFELGESTQFLLNTREQSLQKALQTQAKLQLSRAKAVYAYRQATGNWN